MVSRGLAAAAPLLLIPITLDYLGGQVYGLWMVVASLTGMALWTDLGLGNGLLTKLAPCYAGGDWQTARRYVSTAYAALVLASGVLIGVLWSCSQLIPWQAMVNTDDPNLVAAARTISLGCFSAFLINVPLSLIQRVQYGYQAVARNNMWQAGGSLLSVGLAAGAVCLTLSPAVVVTAAAAGPIIANIANSVTAYTTTLARLAPRLGSIDWTVLAALFRLGGGFFALSIVTAAALNSDSLIIAHALDLQAVTEYSVPARLFGALGLVVTLVNLPLWPASGDALARGDRMWVRRTTARLTAISAAAVLLAATALVVLAGPVLTIWAGDAIDPAPLLLVGLGVWWLLLAVTSPRFMVQNAAGIIRPQFIGWCLFLLVSVAAKWFAAKVFGISGVACAGAVCYLLIVMPAADLGYRQALLLARVPEQSDQ